MAKMDWSDIEAWGERVCAAGHRPRRYGQPNSAGPNIKPDDGSGLYGLVSIIEYMPNGHDGHDGSVCEACCCWYGYLEYKDKEIPPCTGEKPDGD